MEADLSKPTCHRGATYPACALPTDHAGECIAADHPDLNWHTGYHFGRKSVEQPLDDLVNVSRPFLAPTGCRPDATWVNAYNLLGRP